jgi:hypothetical protein
MNPAPATAENKRGHFDLFFISHYFNPLLVLRTSCIAFVNLMAATSTFSKTNFQKKTGIILIC